MDGISIAAFLTAVFALLIAGDFCAVAFSFLVARITRFAAPFTIFAAVAIAGEIFFIGSADVFFFEEAAVETFIGTSLDSVWGDFFRGAGFFFATIVTGFADVFFFSGFINSLGKPAYSDGLKLSPRKFARK